MPRAQRERKRGGYRITFLERLEKRKDHSSLSVVSRKKEPDNSNRNPTACTRTRTKGVDRPKVLDTVQPNMSFAQYLQKATSSSATSLPLGPKSVENEPAAAKIAEMDCQPRRKYRKRDPLADYNKPPVRETSAAEIQPTRLNPLEKSKTTTTGEENNQPESSNGPASSKKSTTTMGEKNRPGSSNGSASSKKSTTTVGEKNQPGSSNGPASSKKSTTSVGEKNQPGSSNGPASSKKSTTSVGEKNQPGSSKKPKTSVGEKNQPGSSNGPASSKKPKTTVGEKRRIGKQNAPGAKSNLKEGLNNIPSASLPQLAKSNPQSPSCDGETTFLCFFCSETKAVNDRHPGRSNTCAQCHAYYMAQVAAQIEHLSTTPPEPPE